MHLATAPSLASAALVAAALLAGPVAVPAAAEELRMATGVSGPSALARGTHTFAERLAVRTEGAYSGRVFENTLLNFSEAMTGLRDGIADVAYVVPAYHRAEFPYSNLLTDAATVSTDVVAVAGAATEFMFTCPACIDEYVRQNHAYLGFSVVGPYYLMSKPMIRTKADFQGKKIRGFAAFGRWVEAMGATPVNMGANDVYEAMSQGQLDGNTHIPETLRSLSIGDVANYLLEAEIGVYVGNANFNLNLDLWNDLSPDMQRAFLLAAGDSIAWTTVTYLAQNSEFYDNPALGNVERVTPDDEVAEATRAFREGDLATVAAENRDRHGIADAEEQLDRFVALVREWEALVAGIDATDVDAVAALYNERIFGKVDPALISGR